MSHPFYRYSTLILTLFCGCDLGIRPVFMDEPSGAAITCDVGATLFGGGAGTQSAPFKICTRAHLAAIAGAYLDRYFIQYENIDLGGAAFPWTPIAAFTGQYDGNSKTISGLYYNGTSNNVGLFGSVDTGGVVKNLSLTGASLTSTGGKVGALVGTADGAAIQNCSSSGSISADTHVGGLVGLVRNSSTITSSSSSVTITATSEAGGLIGWIENSSITSSSASGNVSATGDQNGGLAGYFENTTITSSFATGVVSGNRFIGGLIGNATDTSGTTTQEIQNCHATGNVSGSNLVGGLIGNLNEMDITTSYATGTIIGSNHSGGLVGQGVNGSIQTSYATGNVGVFGVDIPAGGLIGTADAIVLTNVYASGNVAGDDSVGGLVGASSGSFQVVAGYSVGAVSGNSNVGGLVGYDDGTYIPSLIPSYWDTQTSGQAASAIGVGRTTAQMKDFNNFSSWNFITVWNGATYGGSAAVYPFLR